MPDTARAGRALPAALSRFPLKLVVVTALAWLYASAHPPPEMWRRASPLPAYLDPTIAWHEVGNITDLTTSLAACALLAMVIAAGARVARRADALAGERAVIFGLWALAFAVVPAAAIGVLASATGTTLLRPPLGLLLTALPALAFLVVSARPRPMPARARRPAPAPVTVIVALVAAVALGVSALIGLTHPPNGYEALMYHAPLAFVAWNDGNLTSFLDASPDNVTLAHPLAVELWYGMALFIGGEPLANIAQLPFAGLGAASVYAFARRLGLFHRAAQLAAVSFLLVPMLIVQSGMQHNDLSGAAIMMAAFALAAAPGEWSPMRLATIAIGLGLAVTTKLALLPPAAAVGLFVVALTLRKPTKSLPTAAVGARLENSDDQRSLRTRVSGLAIAALAFAVVVAPWWTRNLVRYHNPVFPADLPLIGLGRSEAEMPPKDHEYVPSRAAWLLYPLREKHSDRSGFGALFVSFALPGLVVAVRRARRRPVVLYLLGLAVTLPTWWFMTRHEPRFLIASLGLTFAFVPWALLGLSRRQRSLGLAVLAAAAALSALVTVADELVPLAERARDRVAYFDRWGVDPVVMSLPEEEPILLHTSFARTTYPAYYPLLGRSLRRRVLTMDGDFDTGEIIERMRKHGVRYAYVSVAPEPEAEAAVATMYDGRHFEVAHVSTVKEGKRAGTRRYLFRLHQPGVDPPRTRSPE